MTVVAWTVAIGQGQNSHWAVPHTHPSKPVGTGAVVAFVAIPEEITMIREGVEWAWPCHSQPHSHPHHKLPADRLHWAIDVGIFRCVLDVFPAKRKWTKWTFFRLNGTIFVCESWDCSCQGLTASMLFLDDNLTFLRHTHTWRWSESHHASLCFFWNWHGKSITS